MSDRHRMNHTDRPSHNVSTRRPHNKAHHSSSLDASRLTNFRTPDRSQHHGSNKKKKKRRPLLQQQRSRDGDGGVDFLRSSSKHVLVLTRRRLVCPSVNAASSSSSSGPDSAVRWEAVRYVRRLVDVDRDDDQRCPVCLDALVAPRVARCGHHLCLACWCRHASYFAENAVPTCPCCLVPVHLDGLRPVELASVRPPTVRSTITLTRLHRRRGRSGGAVPYLPVAGGLARVEDDDLPSETDLDAMFSRRVYVDVDRWAARLAEDRRELERRAADASLTSIERTFYGVAAEHVRVWQRRAADEAEEERALALAAEAKRQAYPVSKTVATFVREDNNDGRKKTRRGDRDNNNDDDVNNSNNEDDNDNKVTENNNDNDNDVTPKTPHETDTNNHTITKECVYSSPEETMFYQSSDGQVCFLSRFDLARLSEDYSHTAPDQQDDSGTTTTKPPFPDEISGRVLDVERLTLDPETRARRPFLSHLPLWTDVSLVELEFDRGILSAAARAKFRSESEARAKKRRNLGRRDRRERRAAVKEEEARVEGLKQRYARIDPEDDFFRAAPVEEENTDAVVVDEEFGPRLGGPSSSTPAHAPAPAAVSFRNATLRNTLHPTIDFPALGDPAVDFPALGASNAMTTTTTTTNTRPRSNSGPQHHAATRPSVGRPRSSSLRGWGSVAPNAPATRPSVNTNVDPSLERLRRLSLSSTAPGAGRTATSGKAKMVLLTSSSTASPGTVSRPRR